MECPHISNGYFVIESDVPRHREFRQKYPKRLWCRYDVNDTLDLD